MSRWALLLAFAPFIACRSADTTDSKPTASAIPTAAAADPTSTVADAPQSVKAIAFMRAAGAGNVDEAYALTTKVYRSAVTREEFGAAILKNPYYRGVKGLRVQRTSRSSRTARVEADSDGSFAVWVNVYLVYEDKEWAVSGLDLGGMPGLPAFPVGSASASSSAKK